MDYKDFKDGLTSLSVFLFIFSITFMIGSILMKPYIALEPLDRDFIVILCIINILFNLYYLAEALRLEKVFKLEDKHVLKFGKRIGIITIIYTPHFFLIISLFFRGFHDLQVMMIFLIFAMEGLLIGLVYKEVYDLLIQEEAQVKFELDKNRKRYLN